MNRWSVVTDLRVIAKPYGAFIIYLGVLCLSNRIFISQPAWEEGAPSVYSQSYLYLQMFTCIFVAVITSALFEEAYRPSSREFFRSLPLKGNTIIFMRYLRLLALVAVVYLPTVALAFWKVNASLTEGFAELTAQTEFPLINLWIPLVQCLIAVNFYIIITLFLLSCFKKRIIPQVILLAYCVLESGPLRIMFGTYSIFCGAFNSQDYYHFFPPNIRVLLSLSAVLLTVVLLTYDAKRPFAYKR